MNARKIFVVSLLTNVLMLSVLAGVFAFTQTAQAHSASAPLVGPFNYALSSMDFQSYDDTLYTVGRNLNGIGMYKVGTLNPVVAVAPLHLPTGSIIGDITLDAEDLTSSGDIQLLLVACQIGTSNCDIAATLVTNDGGRAQKTATLNYTVDNASRAYFLQVNYRGGSVPDSSLILYFVRVGYSFPAATFMPFVQR